MSWPVEALDGPVEALYGSVKILHRGCRFPGAALLRLFGFLAKGKGAEHLALHGRMPRPRSQAFARIPSRSEGLRAAALLPSSPISQDKQD